MTPPPHTHLDQLREMRVNTEGCVRDEHSVWYGIGLVARVGSIPHRVQPRLNRRKPSPTPTKLKS